MIIAIGPYVWHHALSPSQPSGAVFILTHVYSKHVSISQSCCLTPDAEGGMWCCSGQSQLAVSGVIDPSVKLIGIIFLFCFVLPREVLIPPPPPPPLTWHAPFVTPTQWRQISSGSISADLGGHEPVSLQMYCICAESALRLVELHGCTISFPHILLIL